MTPDYGRANLTIACAFADELSRRGLRDAVVCPGSRSTPLALALAWHPDIKVWVHIDERSAAYFALGTSRQLREPVALLSTSGTATANFLPAIAEAHLGRIPLIALTADRPPELRDWGAPQTIDQLRLYGNHVKWFVDMPVPTDDEALVSHARASAARAIAQASAEPEGPVHINLPFREPLLPGKPISPRLLQPLYEANRSHATVPALGRSRLAADTSVIAEAALMLGSEVRGIIVCGPGEQPGLASAAASLGAASGYPILADPLSGVRFGLHDRRHVIDAYDPFLRNPDVARRLQPNMVIRVGAIPTSKPLQQFLEAAPMCNHIVIDPGQPRDPSHLATTHIRADPPTTLHAIADQLRNARPPLTEEWLEEWRKVDCLTAESMGVATARMEELFEGRALQEVAALLPDGATLVVGNSMPVRDADAFIRGDERRIRIVGNRGANGIDGVSSSALGAAAVSHGPVVLVVGDLSFIHDLGGLLAAEMSGISLTIVVLNNDGGGIFSFLPQAEHLDSSTFETLFGTPTGLDIGAVASLFKASFNRPTHWSAFRSSISAALIEPGLSIIEVLTDRANNVVQHRRVWSAVSSALATNECHGR